MSTMTGRSKTLIQRYLTPILCFCLLVVYMAQGILITASKNESGGYDYDKNSSVMLSEICKFVISGSILMYQSTKQSKDSPPLTSPIGVQSLKFAVPAVLYALHNNIIFIALELLSPVTYQLYNNIKIVTTGLVFRLFLNRPLRLNQWMAIVLLPLSMCVTQFGPGAANSESETPERALQGFLWMVLLSSCSAFAGVYNEFLLKNNSEESSLMWKNMQLYFYSTLTCAISFHYTKSSAAAGGDDVIKGFLHGFGPMAWGVVLLNGVLGQIISAIFFYADNIVKVYASSGAVLLTPFVSRYFFDTTLDAPLFVGIGIALVSLFLYFLPPKQLFATDSELLMVLKGSPSEGTYNHVSQGNPDSPSKAEKDEENPNMANNSSENPTSTNFSETLIQRSTKS